MNILFFITTTATEIYTLSLHDALPICSLVCVTSSRKRTQREHSTQRSWSRMTSGPIGFAFRLRTRSEEHTSELQSHSDLVCRLLLEKKKTTETLPSTKCDSYLKQSLTH